MKGRIGPLLPNKPLGVLRVDDNNTLTPGCRLRKNCYSNFADSVGLVVWVTQEHRVLRKESLAMN